ncbi:hypothetical protein ACFY2M_41225 [Streptomyces sp. NPDC001276]|uniref:hypothetical protein n=1 Tax=Streptomyces sp. NPDC001276 TaxID=3364555 RepID=UPI003688862E
MARKRDEAPLRDLLRLPVGEPVDLSAYDTGATPGGPDDKAAGLAAGFPPNGEPGGRVGDRASLVGSCSTPPQ